MKRVKKIKEVRGKYRNNLNQTRKETAKKEAEEKWDKLSKNKKDKLEKEFGMLAKPIWIYYVTHLCDYTDEMEKL